MNTWGVTPWARSALTPEQRERIAAARPHAARLFLLGDSPGGPWTARVVLAGEVVAEARSADAWAAVEAVLDWRKVEA